MFITPGFPEEVSEKIETPDIAELLMHPMFMVAEADTVWKYGSEFQKELLRKTPIKNNRKHVTVLSSVHLVHPEMRTMTTSRSDNDNDREWHVDGFYYDGSKEHIEPIETVHLFIAHTTALTEFAAHPLKIKGDIANKLDRMEFSKYLGDHHEELNIVPKSIEPCRIYTFSNHIHRAVPPKKIELRYSWRVRETDRDDIPPVRHQILTSNTYHDSRTQKQMSNILQDFNSVTIFYPTDLLELALKGKLY
jgi:hypothetical protein